VGVFLYQAEEVGTAKGIVKGKKEAVHGIVHGLKFLVLLQGQARSEKSQQGGSGQGGSAETILD
jgi:hypothetical protein